MRARAAPLLVPASRVVWNFGEAHNQQQMLLTSAAAAIVGSWVTRRFVAAATVEGCIWDSPFACGRLWGPGSCASAYILGETVAGFTGRTMQDVLDRLAPTLLCSRAWWISLWAVRGFGHRESQAAQLEAACSFSSVQFGQVHRLLPGINRAKLLNL